VYRRRYRRGWGHRLIQPFIELAERLRRMRARRGRGHREVGRRFSI